MGDGLTFLIDLSSDKQPTHTVGHGEAIDIRDLIVRGWPATPILPVPAAGGTSHVSVACGVHLPVQHQCVPMSRHLRCCASSIIVQ